MTSLTSALLDARNKIFSMAHRVTDTDLIMLDAKCIRMREFETEISKIFRGIADSRRKGYGAPPQTSALRCFAPRSSMFRNGEIKGWQLYKNRDVIS